ncbi:MAG: Fic family protein [Fibrobacteria bacterium]|nr:Fic family protein [Fibrobacteria bacterium]
MLNFLLTDNQEKKLQKLLLDYKLARTKIEGWTSEKRQYVKKQSLISNIGASTRIENALLTDIEIEWIETTISKEPHQEYKNKEAYIKHKLSKDKVRSIEEVAGYRDSIRLVYDLFRDFNPLKIADIKGLHREMLKYYSEAHHYQGDFKKHSNSVIEVDLHSGKKRSVLKTADPGPITATAMRDLVSWYNKEIHSHPWPPAVAVEFVFRFLAIHPFQDGNGRLSRLLFQLALITHENSDFRNVAPLIAIDRTIEQTRSQYYTVLRRCSDGIFNPDPAGYHYHYFFDYMIEVLLNSLDNLQYYEQKFERFAALSDTALSILACFKEAPEQNLKTGDLIAITNIPRRTVAYTLNLLKQNSFLQKLGKGAGTRYKLIF